MLLKYEMKDVQLHLTFCYFCSNTISLSFEKTFHGQKRYNLSLTAPNNIVQAKTKIYCQLIVDTKTKFKM